jgi:threonyl-tRNA synthetase
LFACAPVGSAAGRSASGRSHRLKVRLPDAKVLEVAERATSKDVASAIGAGLSRSAVAARVTWGGHSEIFDLARPLPGDCDVRILTVSDDDADGLYVLRHSTAHVMAEAICRLFPETKLVYGPPVEDGFYYDIDLPQSITAGDFPRIEEEMARIIGEDRPFVRYEMPRADAMGKLQREGNPYKLDNAERAEGDVLSFYVTGERIGQDFEDLCRGPHVPRTGIIKAFKVRQVSRSYYRGDVRGRALQRVYGTAFYKKESLSAYEQRLEEAKRRDHRVLGKELDLFTVTDQVGGGLVLWLPKGAVVRTQLQNYLTGEMLKLGYQLVYTPHIGQLGLYRQSGHYPYYEDSQFPAMFETARGKALQSLLQFVQKVREEGSAKQRQRMPDVHALAAAIQQVWGAIPGLSAASTLEQVSENLYAALADEAGYLLRPMNCPHHIQIYAARPRSYRDLPVRLAEYGTVYRFELSGEISGMIRVRGLTQDDAHLFCTSDQLADELETTVKLSRSVLETLGLTDYRVRVSLRDPTSRKYVGSPENWEKAEAAVRTAARASGMAYTEEPGEAAFYGPKIDFIVKDCIGRSWQLGTVQVDYNQPERFGLTYIGPDNRPHVPVMIHRAPFGSLERFVGILIEHYAGAFPLWLSPVQAAVASVSEKSQAYALEVYRALRSAGLRAEADTSSEKIGPKKHRLRTAKINYILVVGEKEAAERTVNVNDRDGGSLGNMPLERFILGCQNEIQTKGRVRVGTA